MKGTVVAGQDALPGAEWILTTNGMWEVNLDRPLSLEEFQRVVARLWQHGEMPSISQEDGRLRVARADWVYAILEGLFPPRLLGAWRSEPSTSLEGGNRWFSIYFFGTPSEQAVTKAHAQLKEAVKAEELSLHKTDSSWRIYVLNPKKNPHKSWQEILRAAGIAAWR